MVLHWCVFANTEHIFFETYSLRKNVLHCVVHYYANVYTVYANCTFNTLCRSRCQKLHHIKHKYFIFFFQCGRKKNICWFVQDIRSGWSRGLEPSAVGVKCQAFFFFFFLSYSYKNTIFLVVDLLGTLTLQVVFEIKLNVMRVIEGIFFETFLFFLKGRVNEKQEKWTEQIFKKKSI